MDLCATSYDDLHRDTSNSLSELHHFMMEKKSRWDSFAKDLSLLLSKKGCKVKALTSVNTSFKKLKELEHTSSVLVMRQLSILADKWPMTRSKEQEAAALKNAWKGLLLVLLNFSGSPHVVNHLNVVASVFTSRLNNFSRTFQVKSQMMSSFRVKSIVGRIALPFHASPFRSERI